MDRIGLRGLRIDAIVGILPRERVTPQPVEVDLDLFLDLGSTAWSGDLGASVDYATMRDVVVFLVREGRFRLIESLAAVLCDLWRLPPSAAEGRGSVRRARAVLRKPTILGDGVVPEVEIVREGPLAADGTGWDVLADLPECRVARVVIERPWTPPAGAVVWWLGGTAEGPGTALVVMRS